MAAIYAPQRWMKSGRVYVQMLGRVLFGYWEQRHAQPPPARSAGTPTANGSGVERPVTYASYELES